VEPPLGVAVKMEVPPVQMLLSPEMETVMTPLTVTRRVAVAVQPFASVTVTVKVVLPISVTVLELPLPKPFDQA